MILLGRATCGAPSGRIPAVLVRRPEGLAIVSDRFAVSGGARDSLGEGRVQREEHRDGLR